MRIKSGEEEQPEIGLIALIDCIFFLLMFFMVATSFKQPAPLKKQAELPVSLPLSQLSLEPNEAGPAPLVIGVDRDGQLFLDGAPVSTQVLHGRLKLEAAADPGRRVRIDGDQSAKYQDIVHVLDLCQFERLTNIAMHTRSAN
ncbi:biopolymer transport protein ExbD [Duganella sp. CF402]|uniref:ExbD/TolR family protein n=1 Tax=unclassified Duganella TaxID=2636909 RepID=UPI0008C08BD9|nr:MULTISPECIES: biopolymer transporter ExbD [unclassified Duganella]RZT05716.1 biopolymer transport protein ExbD [Duganella sp. BK701]SEM93812.1 biopolymer transport protein ExbD [Duganella sp. CF402]